MSKITQYVRHLAVVAIATLLAQCAWAAEYQLTNATLPQNQANYDNKTLTLTLPVTAAVPSDTVVSVTTIKIGIAGHSTASNLPKFPDKIAINEATSAAGTYADDSTIGSGAGWMTYAFETAVELKAGTAYTITCYNSSDETIDDFRFRVADYNGLNDPKIITISGETRYAPFCTIVGSYESSMPTSTFAFTGNASGGSASGFTISGEGGDATKKTVGPAGTQVPMIYFVSNSDKWHPWANFTAKDTFTLAAYVNTSSCTPAEGKNGVIWSMGNSGGNRVMLVKSSDGKIKLITASGANITNESTAPAFDETAGYHLYTASFSTTEGLKLTVDADTANTKSDSTATTKAADGFQIGSIFQGLQTAKFEVGNNIGVANLIGYDVVLSDSQIPVLAETYPAAAMTIKSDIHQDTANKEVVLMSATTDGNHFIGVSKGTMTIPEGVTVSVPHVRCINNNATGDRATFNVVGTLNITSESSNANVWADRLSYKGVLFGHYHGQGTYNITGTLDAPKTFVELCYTAEDQTLNVNGGTVTTKGIHSNNGQGTVNLSNNGRIALSTSTFMNVPVTVTGGTIAAGETATYAKQLTVSSGELALEIAADKVLTLNGGVSNNGTIAIKSGTVVIPAGSEGTVTVADGASLKLKVTDEQVANGYTATNVTLPADTNLIFIDSQNEEITGTGTTLARAAVVWTGDAGDGLWNTAGNWSSNATPTSDSVLTIQEDAAITMANDSVYSKLYINSAVTFAGTINKTTIHDIIMSEDASITFDITSGQSKINGITGGTIIKNGAGILSVDNINGSALNGTTVQINNGMFLPNSDAGDADMTNPTFILGENGKLQTYGWTTIHGTLTLQSDYEKEAFLNDGGRGGKIKGGPAIIKKGSGTIKLRAGSDANFGAITVETGRLDFGSNQPTVVGGAITGAGAIGVDGTGLVTINGSGSFSGGTVITSGELKLGHTNALGGQGKTVTVKEGGTLNVNGIQNHGLVLTLAGGTLTNGTAVESGNVQFRSIALTADSTANLTALAGIVNNGWHATTLDLGGKTLTKTGAGDLLLCNVTVQNPGLIDMQGGAINRNGYTMTFDMTGVEIGAKKTLIKYPAETSASIDGLAISNADGYILAAEGNEVVVKANTVTITLPTVANTTITKVMAGETEVTVEGGAITVAPGTTVTITYTANAGYVGGGTVTATIESSETVIPTEGVVVQEAVAAIMTSATTANWYATLADAITAATASDYIYLIGNIGDESITLDKTVRIVVDEEANITYGATLSGTGSAIYYIDGTMTITKDTTIRSMLLDGGSVLSSNDATLTITGTLAGTGTIQKAAFASQAVLDLTQGEGVINFTTAPTFGGYLMVVGTSGSTLFTSNATIAKLPSVVGLDGSTMFAAIADYGETQNQLIFKNAPVSIGPTGFRTIKAAIDLVVAGGGKAAEIFVNDTVLENVTIAEGLSFKLSGNGAVVASDDQAPAIDVKGALELGGPSITGKISLSTEGAMVTSAQLAEGMVISGVDGKKVNYTDGVYSLVDDIPPAPTASVADLTEGVPADLQSAYKFTTVEPTEKQAEYYDLWNANFEVSFDKDVKAGSILLKGSYEAWEGGTWVEMTMTDDLAAGTAWTLLPVDQVQYRDVLSIQTFKCGVANLSEANIGTTMTVKLVLSNGTDRHEIVTKTYTLVAPAVLPIDPTEPKGYDDATAATAAAAAINADKAKYIAKPFETMTDTQKAVYDALVTAKVVGNAVVVDFSESGETTAQDSADNALEVTDILDTEKTDATVEAIPGLYYAIVGGTEVDSITTAGTAVQATDTTVTLTKPNLGTTTKAFYKVKISVTK